MAIPITSPYIILIPMSLLPAAACLCHMGYLPLLMTVHASGVSVYLTAWECLAF